MPESAARRGVRDGLRYALGLAVGAAVLLLLAGKRGGGLAAAGHQLGHVDAVWLAAAVAAVATLSRRAPGPVSFALSGMNRMVSGDGLMAGSPDTIGENS